MPPAAHFKSPGPRLPTHPSACAPRRGPAQLSDRLPFLLPLPAEGPPSCPSACLLCFHFLQRSCPVFQPPALFTPIPAEGLPSFTGEVAAAGHGDPAAYVATVCHASMKGFQEKHSHNQELLPAVETALRRWAELSLTRDLAFCGWGFLGRAAPCAGKQELLSTGGDCAAQMSLPFPFLGQTLPLFPCLGEARTSFLSRGTG